PSACASGCRSPAPRSSAIAVAARQAQQQHRDRGALAELVAVLAVEGARVAVRALGRLVGLAARRFAAFAAPAHRLALRPEAHAVAGEATGEGHGRAAVARSAARWLGRAHGCGSGVAPAGCGALGPARKWLRAMRSA